MSVGEDTQSFVGLDECDDRSSLDAEGVRQALEVNCSFLLLINPCLYTMYSVRGALPPSAAGIETGCYVISGTLNDEMKSFTQASPSGKLVPYTKALRQACFDVM